MSHAYRIHKQDAAYFLTMTAVEWLDAFMRKESKMILCDSLNYCIDNKGLEVYAYVIMSSHMHMIASAKQGNLSDIVRDFKKFTSSQIIKTILNEPESRRDWMVPVISAGGKRQKKRSEHQLWQYTDHAVEIYSPKFTLTKVNYIHNNPVEAGLVDRAIDYLFSSAKDYAGFKSPVNVSLINLHSLM